MVSLAARSATNGISWTYESALILIRKRTVSVRRWWMEFVAVSIPELRAALCGYSSS